MSKKNNFPKKFASILEPKTKDVIKPNRAFLEFAACGVTPKSCGWTGWIIEAVEKLTVRKGVADRHILPADDECLCPKCGKAIYRTGLGMWFAPKKFKKFPKEKFRYSKNGKVEMKKAN